MTALQLALALAVAGEFGFLVGYIASERRVMRRVDRRLRRRGIDQLRERLLPSVQFKDRPLEPRVFDDREPTRATDDLRVPASQVSWPSIAYPRTAAAAGALRGD
jgi:hypothetical protein